MIERSMRGLSSGICGAVLPILGWACMLVGISACTPQADGVRMRARMDFGQLCMYVDGEIESVRGLEEELELGEYGIYTLTDSVIEIQGQIRELEFPIEPILDAPNLVELDVTRCPHLVHLGTGTSMFERLDLSKCPELERLEVSSNALHELDLSACPKLRTLTLWDCRMPKLDLSHAKDMEFVNLMYGSIDSIDLRGCTHLMTFSMDGCDTKHLAFNQLEWLDSVFIEGDYTESLEVNGCRRLRTLTAHHAHLQRAVVKDCPALRYMDLSGNDIESIDLANCPALRSVRLFLSNIDEAAMMRVAEALPECPKGQKAEFVPEYTPIDPMRGGTELVSTLPGVSRDVWAKATGKGWTVYRDVGGMRLSPITF